MKRYGTATNALNLLFLIFVSSTLLTLYMLSVQQSLQYDDDAPLAGEALRRYGDGVVPRDGEEDRRDERVLRSGKDDHRDGKVLRNERDGEVLRNGKEDHRDGYVLRNGKEDHRDGKVIRDGKDDHRDGKVLRNEKDGEVLRNGKEDHRDGEVLRNGKEDHRDGRVLRDGNEDRRHGEELRNGNENHSDGSVLRNEQGEEQDGTEMQGDEQRLHSDVKMLQRDRNPVQSDYRLLPTHEKQQHQSKLYKRKILETVTVKHLAIDNNKSDQKTQQETETQPVGQQQQQRSPEYSNAMGSPTKETQEASIWNDLSSDRIIEQLELTDQMGRNSSGQRELKTIVLKSTFDDVLSGQHVFHNCPVPECTLTRTAEQSDMLAADAILFGNVISDPYPYHLRPPGQIWIYFNLESSVNTKLEVLTSDPLAVNWTASYRTDSTIVTPYEKFMLYHSANSSLLSPSSKYLTNPSLSPSSKYVKNPPLSPSSKSPQNPLLSLTPPNATNDAAGKTNKVAWFVSNCDDGNGRRTYARHLSEHISVHVYGACGQRKCPRSTEEYCFSKLQGDYKFYLAFENSNCRDYITEKFFRNALMHDVIPIVMGAPKGDYEKVAPPHSFIHVDDFRSPKHLAEYLHLLDTDHAKYNEYFAWKSMGRFIDTRFFCRLCAMLHHSAESGHVMWKEGLARWWNSEQCIQPNMWASWTKAYKLV